MGKVTAVLGLQWGDEAKGKMVDYLSEENDIVVRFNGSLNAGHTLYVDGQKYVFRMLPCGMLHKHTIGVVANGVMVNTNVLIEEIKSLGLGPERVFVSDNAFLVLPIHKEVDIFRETGKKDFKIGTTKNGIGPSFEDKVRRYGVRLVELQPSNKINLENKLMNITYNYWIKELGYGKNPINQISHTDLEIMVKELINELHEQYEFLKPYLCNTALFLNDRINKGDNVLFEAAQGALLDVDFGSYPFVTSSNCTIGAVSTGSGVPATKIDRVIGVTKSYTTRVGNGPFPTEILETSEEAEIIRKTGNEFGTVTGRPRRVGWLDVPLLNYACMINGVTELVMTKFDVLQNIPQAKVCIGYNSRMNNIGTPQEVMYKNPAPYYVELSTSYIEKYLTLLSRYVDAPITMYSLGPERENLHHRTQT